jgi:salicylate hydroxylase
MAMEDGVTLAECLERANTVSDIPAVLRKYQEIRYLRCKLVQDWSASTARIATLPDGKEQEERDRRFKMYGGNIKQEPWDGVHIDEVPEEGIKSRNWLAWLVGHDAVAFVSEILVHTSKFSMCSALIYVTRPTKS